MVLLVEGKVFKELFEVATDEIADDNVIDVDGDDDIGDDDDAITEVTTTEPVTEADVAADNPDDDDVVGARVFVVGEGDDEVADVVVCWTVVVVDDSVLVEDGEDKEEDGDALFLRPAAAEASSRSNRSSLGYGFSPWLGLFSDKVSMDSIPESSPC